MPNLASFLLSIGLDLAEQAKTDAKGKERKVYLYEKQMTVHNPYAPPSANCDTVQAAPVKPPKLVRVVGDVSIVLGCLA